MRRRRYQSRLNEKLNEDNQARTDVSRKSLPRGKEDTLVPEITFSEIMPNETIQEPSVRRSSRLNATRSEDLENTMVVAATLKRGRSKKFSNTSVAEPSVSLNKSAEVLNAEAAEDPSTADAENPSQHENQTRCSDSEKSAYTLREKPSLHNIEEKPEKVHNPTGTAEQDEIDHEDEGKPGATRDASAESPSERHRKTPSKTPERGASKIPKVNTRAGPKTRSARQQVAQKHGSAVNDENDPGNSLLTSPPIEKSVKLSKKGQGQPQEQVEYITPVVQASTDVHAADFSPKSTQETREESALGSGARSTGKNLHIAENYLRKFNLKKCRVVVERFELPHSVPSDEERTLEPSAAGIDDENEVSIETLEIRKRIERKCLRDSSSSEDEDEGRPGPKATESEKLFDTLIEPKAGRASIGVLDSSSYYHGELPSRAFLPEPVSAQPVCKADSLAERFEAFKQSNSQKTVATRNIAATRATEASVPSFTLEEDPTTDFAEVTQRAITLCNEEDSDADLDVVMASKSRRSAAVGNTMLDPVFCDVGTSMGFPSEHREQDSFVLMIESASRDSSVSRTAKSEPVIRSKSAECWCDAGSRDGCVPYDDAGDELKNPRKSKLQSTLLPSPNLTEHFKAGHDMAVGTGPSLMVTSRCVDSTQQAEASVADGTLTADRSDREQAPLQEGCDDRLPVVDKVPASKDDSEEHKQNSSRIDREYSPEVIDVDASPKLLPVLSGKGNQVLEEEVYETDEVLSDEEEAEEEDVCGQEEENAPEEVEDEANENEVMEEIQESHSPSGERAEAGDQNGVPVVRVIDDSVETPHKNSPEVKTSRESNSLDEDFGIRDEQSRTENPLAGMNDLPLIDLIDVNGGALDLLEFDSRSTSKLSEPPSKRCKSKCATPRLILPETPKSKSALRDDYRIARDIHRGGSQDTPLSLYKEIRKSRVSRRALFDETIETLPEIHTNVELPQNVCADSMRKRRKSFALDSNRLPNIYDTYVETQFDLKEIKRRGDELFQSAVRNILDQNPESKGPLQHALENLLASHQDSIKRMMSLMVRKYALKDLCDARKESYFSTQSRLARTRKYIMDTAIKLMPENECNLVKVFGFNPFEFKDPPPETVREMNKRKAREDEERLKKISKKTF